MNQVELLNQYKNYLISLGKTESERNFIESSFTRWYFAAPRKDLIPRKNIVMRKDLVFANLHKKCRFAIQQVCQLSAAEFARISSRKVSAAEKYNSRDSLVSRPQLDRLSRLYTGRDFENDKNKLLAMYEFIGMNSAHLSIPPQMFADDQPVECFGSPLNTSGQYCSPFAFEKALFGSLGSFFDFKLSASGRELFTANPPFDEDIMLKMANHLLKELAKARAPMAIAVTIPVWDSASQQKLGIRDFGMRFKAYELLTSSAFTGEYDILDKTEYPYWDYYKQAFIPVSYTHLIILTKDRALPLASFKARWRAAATKVNHGAI